MKKKLFALLIGVLGLFSMKAQLFNIPSDTLYQGCQPDSVHLFLFSDSLSSNSYTYDTIPYYTVPVGGTAVNLNDDQTIGPFNIGFEVSWFCGSFTQFYICSNGWIRFASPAAPGNCPVGCWVTNTIPNAVGPVPRNSVMGVWRDWHPGVGAGPYVNYQTIGAAPNRKLVVTWSGVPMFSCTGTTGTFQIVVHETSNIIHTNITTTPVCIGWNQGRGVHGVHDPTGTFGLPVTGRNNTAFTATNESLRFIPTSPITWTNANGNLIGIGNDLWTSSITQSEYIYANGVKCDGTPVEDSVYVVASCINVITDSIDVLCFGDSSGVAIAQDTSTALFPPYFFHWMDQNGDTVAEHFSFSNYDTVFNLPAGEYNVVVTNQNGGDFGVGSIVINEPTEVIADIINPTLTDCPGVNNCDASATAIAGGGTPPYTYLWSSGETTQIANALCPGLNSVTITDAHGCDTLDTIMIGIPDTIITSAFGNALICISNTTPINATSIGGTPPFTYVWTKDTLNGDTVGSTAGIGVDPVLDQRYVVFSTDANGCPGDSSSVLIKVRPELGIELPYLDTICPYDNIKIAVQGTGGDTNYSYAWSSGQFGFEINVSPDEPRWYHVTVSDFCGTPPIVDSVFVQVGGYGAIQAEINITDDSLCVGESIKLEAQGRGGFRGPEEYRFEWSESSWTDNPVQAATPSTTKDYILTITDLCLSPAGLDTVTIYVGDKEYPEYLATPFSACKNADVALIVDDYNPRNTYNWFFGDNRRAMNRQNDTISHRYDETGCYDVRLEVITEFGCYSSQNAPCLVSILQNPTADFTNIPGQPNTAEPFVRFTNSSSDEESIYWYIDSILVSESETFIHEFLDTGDYQVTIRAISADGCSDTITRTLKHYVATTVFLPGSFSPNGDGLNDVWKPVGESISGEGYELEIFDRWGQRLFYTNNPDEGWNGKGINGSSPVQNGSYGFVLRYIDRFNEPKVVSGQIIIGAAGTESFGF